MNDAELKSMVTRARKRTSGSAQSMRCGMQPRSTKKIYASNGQMALIC